MSDPRDIAEQSTDPRSGTTQWYPRPSPLLELTPQFFRIHLIPRELEVASGFPIRTLTPPSRRGFPWGVIVLAIILCAVAAFTYGALAK